MKIHEYQGKEIFKKYQINIPRGIPAFCIEEAKNALNVVPKLIQNFNKFIIETKEKLKKVQKERERKKALREQRKRKLNS